MQIVKTHGSELHIWPSNLKVIALPCVTYIRRIISCYNNVEKLIILVFKT